MTARGPYTPRRRCLSVLATVLVFAGVFAAHVVAVLRVIA